MNENPNRAEAERLLGVAEKLLQSRDFNGTRDFAVLAQETEPLLEGSDQILAVADVLISAEKRINNHHDWYSILQIDRRSNDTDLIKKQYRRLALLLHPDKNKFAFADQAFKLVADAWAVLSDTTKKSLYDNELSLFSKVDLSSAEKLPVRRSQRPTARKSAGENVKTNINVNNNSDYNHGTTSRSAGGYYEEEVQRVKLSSFWTTCPYCFVLYEYPRVYEDCCLRCQNCSRAFHAALLPSMPPLVPGKEAYYCYWGFFPLGYVLGGSAGGGGGGDGGVKNTPLAPASAPPGFPNWMPQMFGVVQQAGEKNGGGGAPTVVVPPAPVVAPPPVTVVMSVGGSRFSGGNGPPQVGVGAPRKRGRPRKT